MNLDVRNKNDIKNHPVNMKRRAVSTGLAVFLSLTPLFNKPIQAEAYEYDTHQFLVSQGILLLKADKGEEVVTKLYKQIDETNGAQILLDYCNDPDFDEINDGYKGHYYDPATGKNYKKDKDSANRRFCDHYDNAVKSYKNGDFRLAYEELSRSLHYLGDLNEPHHAANLPFLQNLPNINATHHGYETWVEFHHDNFAVETALKNTYDNSLDKTTWQIGHNSSVNAKRYINYVKSAYYELDDKNKAYCAKNTLPYAQSASAGVLYKFLNDVGELE